MFPKTSVVAQEDWADDKGGDGDDEDGSGSDMSYSDLTALPQADLLIETTQATDITRRRAIMNGYISGEAGDPLYYYFKYSTNANLDALGAISTPHFPVMTIDGVLELQAEPLNDLGPSTYFFQLYAYRPGDPNHMAGGVLSFVSGVPTGLRNFDVNCYLNANVQALNPVVPRFAQVLRREYDRVRDSVHEQGITDAERTRRQGDIMVIASFSELILQLRSGDIQFADPEFMLEVSRRAKGAWLCPCTY